MSVNLRSLIDRSAATPENDRGAAFCDEDVLEFIRSNRITENRFCDKFAEETSLLFIAGDLSFELADRAMNALNWYSTMGQFKMELLPEFAWQVYLAFDSGEHTHGGRIEDSIESITIPRIKQLLSRCRA